MVTHLHIALAIGNSSSCLDQLRNLAHVAANEHGNKARAQNRDGQNEPDQSLQVRVAVGNYLVEAGGQKNLITAGQLNGSHAIGG